MRRVLLIVVVALIILIVVGLIVFKTQPIFTLHLLSTLFIIKEQGISQSIKDIKECNLPDKGFMSDEERVLCYCPPGYKKFEVMRGSYCATSSEKPCKADTDCPTDEICISKDNKTWFCTGGPGGGCFYRHYGDSGQFCGD